MCRVNPANFLHEFNNSKLMFVDPGQPDELTITPTTTALD